MSKRYRNEFINFSFPQALNELAEQQNIPFEFIDGFVAEITVTVPWSSILNDATYIEVKGLSLTIRQKERCKTSKQTFIIRRVNNFQWNKEFKT